MKKMFSMMLIMASFVCLTACSNDDEPYVPQDVEFALDYTFIESGAMSRATGADIYNGFYEKYIETRQLTPTTYSLTFTNKETGAIAIINGRWDKKDGIRLPEGNYNITGFSTPIEKDFKEWSDSVYLAFDEDVTIKKDMTQLTLTAIYDSYLLLLDTENSQSVVCKCRNLTSTSKNGILNHDDMIFWLSMQKTYRDYKANDYYLTITRNDGQKSTINLLDIPFEKGRYYYFNDMTNSFNIPKMESGN